MPAARYALYAGVIGGKMYTLGGQTESLLNANYNEEYDPVANTWATKAVMPSARYFLSAGAIGGKLYAVGGTTNHELGNYLNTNEEYDPGVASSFEALTPNTQYFFKAKARNVIGAETGEGPVVSTYTLAVIAQSTGSAFTDVFTSSATVNWSSGTAAGGFNGAGASYKVQVSTVADFSAVSVSSFTLQPSALSFIVPGLSPHTTYYFRAQAYNTDGVTDYSWLVLGSTATAWPVPAGCGYTLNVAQSGVKDHSSIQAAVAALNHNLTTDTCVVIRDTETYSEQVTVEGFANNNYRLKIIADPTFISSAPVVNPPVTSTAAFQIINDSVTVQGINIVSTNTVAYGILSSSASVNISSVNVDSGGMIWSAGIQISSYSAVSYSSITVQVADGLQLIGSNAEVSFSTMTSNNSGRSAIYIINSDSNTITHSFMSNPAGHGLFLESGADYNNVSDSTITSSGIAISAFSIHTSSFNNITRSYISNSMCRGVHLAADYNTISDSTITSNGTSITCSALLISGNSNNIIRSDISNPAGSGAYLYYRAAYNTISDSTMTSNGSGYPALYISSANSNNITRSYMSNPAGWGVELDSGAAHNTISDSTVTSNNADYSALYISGSSSNTVSGSYIQGSTAAYITGSTGTVIGGSVLIATNTAGYALRFAGGSMNLALSTSTLSGGPQGAGIYLDENNSGVINLSSNTISGGQYGLNIAAQSAGASLDISSMTFSSLTAGATAINFLGGQFVSTFTGVAFNSANITVNVNGSSLASGSRIIMSHPAGVKLGTDYENDPAAYINWLVITATLVSPADGAAGVSQSPGLHAKASDTGSAVQYNYQIDTLATMNSQGGAPLYDFDQSAAQAFANSGAFSGQDGTISSENDAYLNNSTATFVFYSVGTHRLTVNTQYYWRVRAKTAEIGVFGAWSSTAGFTTGEATAEAPVNNLAVANVSLSNATGVGVTVNFTVRENNDSAGTTPNGGNYNTADWLFVKFSTQAGADGTWNHATLAAGGGVGVGGALTLASDNKGAFVNHAANYALWQATASVVWNYPADGVNAANARGKGVRHLHGESAFGELCL